MLNPTIEFQAMLDNADSVVGRLTPQQVNDRVNIGNVMLIDIRDVRELEKEGRVPGSKHIPQGMLEFWMHPQSPYYKDYFDDVGEIILHCNRGWRSALAAKALLDIGIEVVHMSGGFAAWQQSGLPVETYKRK